MTKLKRVAVVCGALVTAACVDAPDDAAVSSTDQAAMTAPPGTTRVVPIAERSWGWTYDADGQPLPDHWKHGSGPTFDPGLLTEDARGPFGYGEPYLETVIRGIATQDNQHTTVYARHDFSADPAEVEALYLRVMYDDGFVAYLNGVEVARRSLPPGPIAFATPASGHEAGNRYEAIDLSAFIPVLIDGGGRNSLAVEIHQASPSSSDLVLDAELIAWTNQQGSITGGIEASSSPWRFWDQGGSPGADWTLASHDEQAWSTSIAPFGYGEPYIETELASGSITSYFRAHTSIDHPEDVTELSGTVRYDDGFVMYLNGHEVLRRSMPAGTVTATTQAIGHEATGYEAFDITAHREHLIDGVNIVAVEVHQSSASSSDLVFDLGLELERRHRAPISAGSVWEYRDTGPYNDGEHWSLGQQHAGEWSWPSAAGPFGYGESYLTTIVGYGGDAQDKQMTTYFRREFVADFETAATSMIADVMYDDGFVVWLNGEELVRVGMPAGEISHDTAALGYETGNRYQRFDWSQYAHLVRRGSNWIGVEVHQAAPTSSDLTFDLALDVLGD